MSKIELDPQILKNLGLSEDMDNIHQAQKALEKAVENAQQKLAQHPMAPVVAKAVCYDQGHKGTADLRIDPEGVYAVLSENPTEKDVTVVAIRNSPDDKPSQMPLIAVAHIPTADALRQQARDLGVDASHRPLRSNKQKAVLALELVQVQQGKSRNGKNGGGGSTRSAAAPLH